MNETTPDLPAGVRLLPLQMHQDNRGVFAEVYRQMWDTGIVPVQWSFARTAAGSLRGVNVHIRDDHYLIVLRGQACVGLRDLRRGSPSEGRPALVELTGERLVALTIPRGVAHGFYAHEESEHIVAASQYWDPADDHACHWADPALQIPWPFTAALASELQATAPTLSDLIARLEPFQPIG